MKYFAYGSNMYTSRLRECAPSCQFYTVATLKGYTLKFHKKSTKDKSGKCNAWLNKERPEDLVIGVVFDITEEDGKHLDEMEVGYHRIPIRVKGLRSEEEIQASMYVADDNMIDDNLLPYKWYKDVVVQGAKEHNFPDAYIRTIEEVNTLPEEDEPVLSPNISSSNVASESARTQKQLQHGKPDKQTSQSIPLSISDENLADKGNAHTSLVDAYGRLDVTISDEVYEAGSVSTVTLLFRNPFDKPVEVLEIQGPRSSYLSEIARELRAKEHKDQLSAQSQAGKQLGWLRSTLKGFYKEVVVSELSFGGVTVEFPKSQRSFNIQAEPNSEIVVDTDLSNYDSINVAAEQGATVKFLPQIHTQVPLEKKTITIEPHCEAVAYFQISTASWLFFTPTRRSHSTQIRYRINGKEKTQVTTAEFNIKPPLRAMVIGSVAGAILGTLAKALNAPLTLQWQSVAVSIGASVVMSLIATIALSRKTGAQGFITVEDFFGGFVVGALIGYGGTMYFERAIIPQTPSS